MYICICSIFISKCRRRCSKNKLAGCVRTCRSPYEHILHKKDWALEIMKREVDRYLNNTLINYTIWTIPVNNIELLTIHGYSFNKALVIFGYKKMHWAYHDEDNVVQDSFDLPTTFCGCCLDRQYLKIMKRVQNYMEENKYSFLTNLKYISGMLQVPRLDEDEGLEEEDE
uniref:Uncharacterized protein n=1 Tax=Glossina brevipalpis TaxID=37001 RepID=A0A1A9WTZ2_9MUSC